MEKLSTVSNRIRALGKVTNSEEKIADYIEKNYSLMALETLTSISEHAGVGKATVVRFISKLGFESFADFHENVRTELLSRLHSPMEQYSLRKSKIGDEGTDFLSLHTAQVEKNLKETLARIDQKDFNQAAQEMAFSKGKLYVMGQRTSYALANYFWVQMNYFREDIYLLDHSVTSLPQQLMQVGPDDLLFVISHSRYTQDSLQVARWFHKRDAKLVVLTDRENMPMSDIASLQLVAPSESQFLFNSRCASMVVIEALLGAMAMQLETQMYERSKLSEELFSEFKTYVAKP